MMKLIKCVFYISQIVFLKELILMDLFSALKRKESIYNSSNRLFLVLKRFLERIEYQFFTGFVALYVI